jgi:hypothetical protein
MVDRRIGPRICIADRSYVYSYEIRTNCYSNFGGKIQWHIKKRKKKRIFPWVLGFLCVVFVALLVLQMTSEKNTNVAGLPEGSPAPKFELQSTVGEISLKDFKGKNVVLYFYEGNS